MFVEAESMMNEEVGIQNPTAYAGAGAQPTLGASVPVRASIKFSRYRAGVKPIENEAGTYMIHVPADTAVTIASRLTLPASYHPRTPKITSVETVKDEFGLPEIIRIEAR